MRWRDHDTLSRQEKLKASEVVPAVKPVETVKAHPLSSLKQNVHTLDSNETLEKNCESLNPSTRGRVLQYPKGGGRFSAPFDSDSNSPPPFGSDDPRFGEKDWMDGMTDFKKKEDVVTRH
jgi:hypothetical protein